jgi:Alginate export
MRRHTILAALLLPPALPPAQAAFADPPLPDHPPGVSAPAPQGTSPASGDVTAATDTLSATEVAKLRNHLPNWGAFNFAGGAAAGFGTVSRYGTVRWAEDWSVLRDPRAVAADHDPFDALKFIPLNDDKTIYLTFSGEERLKNWFESRPSIGTKLPNDSGRMTLRSLYGADLHLGEHFRVYGELINAAAGGWAAYGYNAGYRTRLDLQQLFGEVTGTVTGAKSGLMAGRMAFLDAPDYVLYYRTISSVPQSWNGARGYMIWPRVRIDLFDFVRTDINPASLFHDKPDWNNRLYGAYGSYALPGFRVAGQDSHVLLDLFYLGYLLNGSFAAIPAPTKTGTLAGSTRRDNIGVRLWGTTGPVEFSLGAIYQGGEFRQANSEATRPVEAYAINTKVGWRFADTPGHVLAGVQFDVYSGADGRKTTGTVGTYLAPYVPSSNYLDTTAYLGPSNLVDVAPLVETNIGESVSLKAKLPFFWRANKYDALYSAGGNYVLPDFQGSYVGFVPQMNLVARLTRHLVWQHDLGQFLASDALKAAGASDATYYLSTLTFTF